MLFPGERPNVTSIPYKLIIITLIYVPFQAILKHTQHKAFKAEAYKLQRRMDRHKLKYSLVLLAETL